MFIHSYSAIAFFDTSYEGKILPRRSTADFKKAVCIDVLEKDEINLAVQSRSLVPVIKGKSDLGDRQLILKKQFVST